MLSFLIDNRSALQQILLFATFGIALWRGGGPEKLCAGTFVGMWIADRVYHAILTSAVQFESVDLVHLGIDMLATAVLLKVALKANRLYPLWLTALQLAATLSHLFRAASPALQDGAYSIFIVAPSYLQIPSLAIALLLHLRRQRKHGPYPSWQNC